MYSCCCTIVGSNNLVGIEDHISANKYFNITLMPMWLGLKGSATSENLLQHRLNRDNGNNKPWLLVYYS